MNMEFRTKIVEDSDGLLLSLPDELVTIFGLQVDDELEYVSLSATEFAMFKSSEPDNRIFCAKII
jgi:hypothetical protein